MRHDEEIPQPNGNTGEEYCDDHVYPQIAGYTCPSAIIEPIEKGHRKYCLQHLVSVVLVYTWHAESCLTAKNVPGRNTIVTKEIDRMTLESWFVASAISTAVSLCDYSL